MHPNIDLLSDLVDVLHCPSHIIQVLFPLLYYISQVVSLSLNLYFLYIQLVSLLLSIGAWLVLALYTPTMHD